MSIVEAIVLGFVQGATEFLPISSSAHLVLVPKFLGWAPSPMSFDVFLHAGTLVALIIYFWPEVVKYIVAFFKGIPNIGKKTPSVPFIGKKMPQDSTMSYNILLALLPVVALGFLFKDNVEQAFLDPKLTSWLLLVTAALLFIATRVKGKRQFGEIGWVDALTIGFAQAIALLPGISRSGATIAGGRAMMLDRESSAKFAFLIAIPAIGAATLLSVWDIVKGNAPLFFWPSLIGFVVSAIVGYISVVLLFKLIKRHGFDVFVIYLIALFIVSQIIL